MLETVLQDNTINTGDLDCSDSGFFRLNLETFSKDLSVKPFVDDLRLLPAIDSQVAFNQVCTDICRLWRKHFRNCRGPITSLFTRLDMHLEETSTHENVISTSWGGVVVENHQPPEVEKFLLVRQGGYLALEKHSQKDERIEVREGAGILLWRQSDTSCLSVYELRAGDEFHFGPGEEHCVIGTQDLLLFERSTDPLGMDQDLLFIYTPEVN